METLIGMERSALEELEAHDVDWFITPDELLYTAGVFDAFWQYNSDAAKEGRKGLHAELKSGLHSNGFFASKYLLPEGNMMSIMAHQLVGRLMADPAFRLPDLIFGVPTSATLLAQEVGRILQVPVGMMEKQGEEGMVVRTPIQPGALVLLVEDVCTRATGFQMAVAAILRKQPMAEFLPFDPVILNRGPRANLWIGRHDFKVVAVGSRLMNDWDPRNGGCPLCEDGSESIKPKASPENWEKLIRSQL